MGRYVKINGELVPIADMGGESQSTNFVGTLADWEALTQEQKNAYDSVDLIDDFSDEITEELDALNDRVGDAESNITTINSRVNNLADKTSCIVNRTTAGLTQTSYQIPSWGTYFNGLIVGFMNNVGSFVGIIYGTTYTKIAGSDVTNNISLSISNDGTLTISSTYTFTCTVIRGR